jgi:hypothetical protein
MNSKRGQITIFIIIGIIIVSATALFFVFRGDLISTEIPSSIEPIYTSFLACLEENTLTGISVLESQGGYIELPEFEPGSSFMPFSSQLDFLGNPIPYWYYVSGNNIQREQVPTESGMEGDLGNFIEEEMSTCVFDDYYVEGFEVSFKEAEVETSIHPNSVDVSVKMDLNVTRGEDSVLIKNHEISVSSKLGTLYQSAKEVYEYEQETLFLEDYAIDILRLYAPVDGVELTCGPLTWTAQDVLSKLQNATEANILAIKTEGDSFTLSNSQNKYFVEPISVEGDVRFLNSRDWPYSFNVNPSEGSVLLAKPVGNQPGMGILGFCYVPYHYVYDYKYPILVQVSSGLEIFQFPFAVVIQGNNPREPFDVSAIEIPEVELCKYKNTEIEVNVIDTNLNPVNAEISYQCFGVKCDMGKAIEGTLTDNFPQCANGFVISKAEGFRDKTEQFSTVESGTVDVVMDRLYEKNVELKLDGREYTGRATISFIHEESLDTIVYPDQKTIKLGQGQYEVQVQIYRNSSIVLGARQQEQCVDVPISGLGSFFGLTKEECFTVDFPEQVISNSLSGGGKQNYFVLESQLTDSNIVEINADSLPTPSSVDQLSRNYILFEEKGLEVNFK